MAETKLNVHTLSKEQRSKLQSFSRAHEISATFGVFNMLATTVVAVRFPEYYWIWHILRTSFYIPVRYVRFKKLKWELYLLDWCYVVTYVSTICSILAFVRILTGFETFLADYNTALIHAGFAMSTGPLAWSVWVFRNSVVFHDVDHSTSVFIHLSPFLMFWCLRWGSGVPSAVDDTWPDMFKICQSGSFDQVDACFENLSGMFWCSACGASPWAFVLPPAMLYLCVWSIPYYTVVLVLLRDWCEKTGHETLYSYTLKSNKGLIEVFAKRVKWLVGERNAGPFGYMLLHFVSIVVFSATGFIFWHSFVLHTLWMVLVLIKAIDNGSSFMFRVFAYRYANDSLATHKGKLE